MDTQLGALPTLRAADGRPLTVWLLSPHDRIPSDSWGYERGLILTQALAAAGANVVFWAGTFAHSTKKVRGAPWQRIANGISGEIVLVPVRPYRKHGSVARLLSLFDFGRNMLRHQYSGSTPDVILTVMPTPFVDVASVLLARRYKAKFIQDFRDLWPELFVYAFRPRLRWLARVGIQPLKWLRRYATAHSDAVISVTYEYLDFAKRITRAVGQRPNEVIYFGVDPHVPDLGRISPQRAAELTRTDPQEVWFVYGGTLGDNYDISTVLATFAELARGGSARRFRLNIAGDGPLAGQVREAAAQFPDSIRYFGPLSKDELWVLLKSSDVGLLPYAKFSTVSVPAKTFDYIAAGLAIINSLPGEVESIVGKNGLGRSYEAGSTASLGAAVAEMMGNPGETLAMKARSTAIAPEYSQTAQYARLPRLVARLCGMAP